MSSITFMLRVRGISNTIEYSIRSITTNIPHEILCIFNGEIDTDTRQRVEALLPENPNLKILVYPYNVSRPGLECAVTPPDSNYSLVKFMNWCVEQSSKEYIFKWDADWIASPPFWKALEEKWVGMDLVRLPVRFYGTGHDTVETYLFRKTCFNKYVLCEIFESPVFKDGVYRGIELKEHILHLQEDKNVEHQKMGVFLRWWDVLNTDEAKKAQARYNFLLSIINKRSDIAVHAHTAQVETDNLFRLVEKIKPLSL
jgi:hypothetical protein